MSTQLVSLAFSSLTDANPAAPPAGWNKPAAAVVGRIVSGYFARGAAGNSVWMYDTPFSTTETEISFRLPTSMPVTGLTLSGISGAVQLDSSGNGYSVNFFASGSNFVIRLHRIVSYALSTQLYTGSILASSNLGKYVKAQRLASTGVMKIYLDAAQQGTDITDTTYNPNYAGVAVFEANGGVHTVVFTDLASYAVESFNGANSIERGQQNVVYATSGFASISAITTNTTGVTVNGIADTVGDGNADVSDYVEGGLYPELPTAVIYTFGDGVNTAPITKTLTIKSTEVSVLTSGLVTLNSSFIGYHILAAGRSVDDGCQMVYPATAGLVINQDGSFTLDPIDIPSETVTIPIWYRDVGNGRMYEFITTFAADDEGSGEITITRALKRSLKSSLKRPLKAIL